MGQDHDHVGPHVVGVRRRGVGVRTREGVGRVGPMRPTKWDPVPLN